MSHTIDGMVHDKLVPAGWESQQLSVYKLSPWIRESSGVWKSNPLYSDRQIITNYYDEKPATMEMLYTFGFIRACCNKISFEWKANSTAHITNEPPIIETVYNMINVSFYSLTNRGLININGETESTLVDFGLSGDTDWVTVNYELTSRRSGIIAFSAAVQALLYRNGNIEWYDWSNDQTWIRNIRTSPPSIVCFPPPVGAKNNAISSALAVSLALQNPTWFQGKWNCLNSIQLKLSLKNISGYGVTKTALASAVNLDLSLTNPAYVWSVPPNSLSGAKEIFTMTITGDTDIEVPISSFQSVVKFGGGTKAEYVSATAEHNAEVADFQERIAEGYYDDDPTGRSDAENALWENYLAVRRALELLRPSYLSCVVPNSALYADEISNRTDGEIIIKKGYLMPDGTRNLEEITRVSFDYLSIDRGARSDSGTVVGYKVRKFTSPKRRTVTGVSSFSMDSTGLKRICAAVDLFLRPGDTCVYGSGVSDYFIVGQITYSVNDRLARMDVTESDEEFT